MEGEREKGKKERACALAMHFSFFPHLLHFHFTFFLLFLPLPFLHSHPQLHMKLFTLATALLAMAGMSPPHTSLHSYAATPHQH